MTAAELWEKMLHAACAEYPDDRWRLDRADFVAVVQPLLDEIDELNAEIAALRTSGVVIVTDVA
jgi:hypothetical protein